MGLIDNSVALLRTLTRGKFSKRQGKMGPVGPKRGNKNYYKGKGGVNVGTHTSKGGYKLDTTKIPVIVVPPIETLRNSPLKPYVQHNPM